MRPLRLCVDLNVWIGAFIADAKGVGGTASQAVVEAVRDGRAAVGPVQLVVSHAMLTRLLDVLSRHGATERTASLFVAAIESFALLGPAGEAAHVVLGGGVLATRDARMTMYDPYDPAASPKPSDREDGRVLDAAVAGRADALVTANLKDFVEPGDEIVVPGRVAIKRLATGPLVCLRPQEMAAWLRTGRAPAPASSITPVQPTS
jgi:predicted nucleic acid-binding protein